MLKTPAPAQKEYFGYKPKLRPKPRKSVRLSLLNGESGQVEVFSTRNQTPSTSLEDISKTIFRHRSPPLKLQQNTQ